MLSGGKVDMGRRQEWTGHAGCKPEIVDPFRKSRATPAEGGILGMREEACIFSCPRGFIGQCLDFDR